MGLASQTIACDALRVSPYVHRIWANGLEHRCLEWKKEPSCATAVLLHGYMDNAATWDLVAPALVDAGFRVLAPDVRGFGEGPRAPQGTGYYFADYVADLADLLDALVEVDSSVFLVGHSMGGVIATYYVGSFPEKIHKIALLEGLGPPDNPPEVAPDRMRRWIEERRSLRMKDKAYLLTQEEAYRRLVLNHPSVDPVLLQSRLAHLAYSQETGHVWHFDPMQTVMSPMPFFSSVFRAFASRIQIPVLHVGGGKLGFHPPDEEERLGAIAQLDRVELEGAGHMMHWTKPGPLADALVRFWKGEQGQRAR